MLSERNELCMLNEPRYGEEAIKNYISGLMLQTFRLSRLFGNDSSS